MRNKISGLAIFFCLASLMNAQVLTTAETLGKGKQVGFASENRLYVDGFMLNIAYAQYIRGLTNSLDLYLSIGDTRTSQQDQGFVGAGFNYHLFKVEKISVSSFNILSTGVNSRKDSSTVLLDSAIIASRNINKTLGVYSGINSLWPIGARERGLFTPPDKKINVPIGLTISHDAWTIFFEYDIGRLKSFGSGGSGMF